MTRMVKPLGSRFQIGGGLPPNPSRKLKPVWQKPQAIMKRPRTWPGWGVVVVVGDGGGDSLGVVRPLIALAPTMPP